MSEREWRTVIGGSMAVGWLGLSLAACGGGGAGEAAEQALKRGGVRLADDVTVTQVTETRARTRVLSEDDREYVLDVVKEGGQWTVENCVIEDNQLCPEEIPTLDSASPQPPSIPRRQEPQQQQVPEPPADLGVVPPEPDPAGGVVVCGTASCAQGGAEVTFPGEHRPCGEARQFVWVEVAPPRGGSSAYVCAAPGTTPDL